MPYIPFTNFNIDNNEHHFPNLTTNRLKAAQILWNSAFGILLTKSLDHVCVVANKWCLLF